jgi:hypothetical protein
VLRPAAAAELPLAMPPQSRRLRSLTTALAPRLRVRARDANPAGGPPPTWGAARGAAQPPAPLGLAIAFRIFPTHFLLNLHGI